MRLLVCDDDVQFARRLADRIQAQVALTDRWVKVDCLQNPATLPQEDLARYDVAFLDIDMEPFNGMELARRLRAARRDTILIFITNYIDYSPQGYEVQAFRYLLKSELEQKLEDYVDQALAAWYKERDLIRIRCEGEDIDIPSYTLVYVETTLRRLLLHLCNAPRTTLRTRMTMRELSELLAARGFLRIHKSFLVNMAYIQKLQSTAAYLTDGTVLPVSSHNYTEIKKVYLQWKGQKRWSIG